MTRPEVVVLVGPQAAGKSTFYRQRFAATHAHVSKDLMRNASRKEARQLALVAETLARGVSLVVDNTNPAVADRQGVIAVAKAAGARVTGYWFPPDLPVLLARNAAREGRARVPDVGLYATLKRLVRPTLAEGFDDLFAVRAVGHGRFDVRRLDQGGNALPADVVDREVAPSGQAATHPAGDSHAVATDP